MEDKNIVISPSTFSKATLIFFPEIFLIKVVVNSIVQYFRK